MLTLEIYNKWAKNGHVVATGTSSYGHHVRLTQDMAGTFKLTLGGVLVYMSKIPEHAIEEFNSRTSNYR